MSRCRAILGDSFQGKNALYEADNTLNYFYVCVPYWFWESVVAQKAIVSTIKYREMSNITVSLLLTYLIWDLSIYCSNFWNLHCSQD